MLFHKVLIFIDLNDLIIIMFVCILYKPIETLRVDADLVIADKIFTNILSIMYSWSNA